jgi:DNA polymerase-1
VKADYSQIELRIAAKVSGDQNLLAAYRDGKDLHVETAKAVLKIENPTKSDRQLAKALNFGLLYGMGANGFRQYARTTYHLDLTEEQAAGYRRAFFTAYSGLTVWHRKSGANKAAIETRTLTGRRRINVERFTEKLNMPVQGTGADGMKTALALLHERRDEVPDAVPVLAVHDEIVVEVPEANAGAAKAWLVKAMTDGMAPLVEPVPVVVDVRGADDHHGFPLFEHDRDGQHSSANGRCTRLPEGQ